MSTSCTGTTSPLHVGIKSPRWNPMTISRSWHLIGGVGCQGIISLMTDIDATMPRVPNDEHMTAVKRVEDSVGNKRRRDKKEHGFRIAVTDGDVNVVKANRLSWSAARTDA
ncbi:hypothetical protein ACLOJK_029611 [Asimina triloba]